MSLLIISVCVGILATALMWMDHTMFQSQETSTIEKGPLMKVFLLGFMSSYITGSLVSSEETLPDVLSDSLKTGRPSF